METKTKDKPVWIEGGNLAVIKVVDFPAGVNSLTSRVNYALSIGLAELIKEQGKPDED